MAQRLVRARIGVAIARSRESVDEVGARGSSQHDRLLKNHRVPLAAVQYAARRVPDDGAEAGLDEAVAQPQQQ